MPLRPIRRRDEPAYPIRWARGRGQLRRTAAVASAAAALWLGGGCGDDGCPTRLGGEVQPVETRTGGVPPAPAQVGLPQDAGPGPSADQAPVKPPERQPVVVPDAAPLPDVPIRPGGAPPRVVLPIEPGPPRLGGGLSPTAAPTPTPDAPPDTAARMPGEAPAPSQ